MIHNEILKKQSDKIISLIDKAEASFEEDDELRSHLAKYICILCSGFLENVTHHTYSSYVKTQTGSASLISFSTVVLSKIQNPNAEKLREIARNFNPEWGELLNAFLQDEERSAAINYIMRDRHKIAHGKDSDITLKRIREYHNKSVEVVEYLERQCALVPAV